MNIRTGRSALAVRIALVAVGALLTFLAVGAGPLPGDLILARLLQGPPLPGGVTGALLSNVDRVVWLVLIAALGIALLGRRWPAALLIFLASLTAVLTGVGIKLLVARPRPPAELVRVYDPSQTFSFPSITSFLSVVLLGAIVYLISRSRAPRSVFNVALGISSVLVLVIGLSRVYVGEHWPTDVLGGWLFGVAWLLVLIGVHRRWLPGRGGLEQRNGQSSRRRAVDREPDLDAPVEERTRGGRR